MLRFNKMVADNLNSPDSNTARPQGQPWARIVYWSNGSGLSRSARIVSEGLTSAGWWVELVEDVRFSTSRYRVVRVAHRCRRWLRHGLERGARAIAARAGWIEQADLNIFLEELVPSQFSLAKRNVWIPNQEWMPLRWKPYLPSLKELDVGSIKRVPRVRGAGAADKPLASALDGIWVKTRYAEQLFNPYSPLVTYVGFSSFDRYDPSVDKEPHTFLHLAGQSLQKGTPALLEAWRRHPEWPTLVMIQNPKRARVVKIPNVDYRPIRIDDEELRLLQNRSEFHLYPSEAEGFGHVLCESMGLGGIVLSTDAPPMNELVTNDRGILVSYDRTSQQGLGTTCYASVSSIEAAVNRLLQLSENEKQTLRERARAWFLDNHARFTQDIAKAAAAVMERGRSS